MNTVSKQLSKKMFDMRAGKDNWCSSKCVKQTPLWLRWSQKIYIQNSIPLWAGANTRRDHPTKAEMLTRWQKVCTMFPCACLLPIKVEHLRHSHRRAYFSQMAPFRPKVRRDIQLLSYHKHVWGRGWNFKNCHCSCLKSNVVLKRNVRRATVTFQCMSGIFQFDAINQLTRNLTRLSR